MKLTKRSDRGAALVEFALVLPLFLVLVFGIMESGWFFAQQVEARNAAREGARLAVVDFPDPGNSTATEIIDETCARAQLSASGATVTLSQNGSGVQASAIVTFTLNYQSLTGFLPMFNDKPITSTAEMRIERESVTWEDMTKACDP